jgi:hypothetical protein
MHETSEVPNAMVRESPQDFDQNQLHNIHSLRILVPNPGDDLWHAGIPSVCWDLSCCGIHFLCHELLHSVQDRFLRII